LCLSDFARLAKNERICPATSDSNLALACPVILDFFSRHRRAAFGVLFELVQDLLFTILFKSFMLPSMSRSIQPLWAS
jgi:hypothetical protein